MTGENVTYEIVAPVTGSVIERPAVVVSTAWPIWNTSSTPRTLSAALDAMSRRTF